MNSSVSRSTFIAHYIRIYGPQCICCEADAETSFHYLFSQESDHHDSVCDLYQCSHCHFAITAPILSETACMNLYSSDYTQMPTGVLGFNDDKPAELFPAAGFLQKMNRKIYHDLFPRIFCTNCRWHSIIRPFLFSRWFSKFFIGFPYYFKGTPTRMTRPRILDCGTGQGRFIALFPPNSAFEISGIDINPAAIDFCRHYRLPVEKGDLRTCTKSGFAFIRLWHVLEHVANPVEYIRAAHDKLEKDGVLILGLPLFNPWTYRVVLSFLPIQVWLHLPFHRFHWNLNNIKRMLIKNGFSVISARSKSSGSWKTMTLSYNLGRRRRASSYSLPKFLETFLQVVWFFLDIPLDFLNGGDTMEIYARKVDL